MPDPPARAVHGGVSLLDVDAQWAVIEPVLPAAASTMGRGRPEAHARRIILNAVLYLVAEGAVAGPARRLPALTDRLRLLRALAPGRHLAASARRTARPGPSVRLLEGRGPLPTAAVIDSQSVKAADTVGPARRGYDAGKKINGVKRHVAVDTLGLLLVVMVTAANVQDRDGAQPLLALLRERFPTIALVWADGGYAGRLVTWAVKVARLSVTIVKRTDATTSFTVLPRRWVVERTLAWLTSNRRLVRDYERRTDTHETMTTIAMIALMSRRLARAA